MQTSTLTHPTLTIDRIERIMVREEKSGRRYGAETFGYTLLWAHGYLDDQPTTIELLTSIHRYWGLLTTRRLQALHETRPSSLCLIPNTLHSELNAWVGRAKEHHTGMKRTWEATAQTREAWGKPQAWGVERRINPAPYQQMKVPGTTRTKLQARVAHCQLCGEVKPQQGMKGLNRDFKRICKDCRKVLDL